MENLERIKNFKGTNETKIKNGGKSSTNNSLLNSKLQTPNSHLSTPTSHISGITLIALVVTIVILLILVAITINLVLAEGGLFERAEQSEEEHSEGEAREALELELADIQIEKLTKYNQNEAGYNSYLEDQLSKGRFVISEDIVFVDEWKFLIDRVVPKIISSLGKGEKSDQIQIEKAQDGGFVEVVITVTITSTEELKSVTIDGEKVEELTNENGVYTITKKVNQNKTYTIFAEDINGKQNWDTIEVSSITEDFEIWNIGDLKQFRNNVNEGRTYEGKTVTVMADIDLNKGKYTVAEDGTVTFTSDAEQWIPIANYASDTSLTFNGTFEGNNHTISNIYINSTTGYQGLFGMNHGTIKNVSINGSIISSKNYIGGIAGYSYGYILNCHNNTYVKGNQIVGGVCGNTIGLINNCSNTNEIFATYANVGGIAGITSFKNRK